VKGIVDVKDRFGSIIVKNIQGSVTIVGGNGPVELTDAGISKVDNSFGPVTVGMFMARSPSATTMALSKQIP